MLDVQCSSFKTSLYGIIAPCESLSNNLALMGFIRARIFSQLLLMAGITPAATMEVRLSRSMYISKHLPSHFRYLAYFIFSPSTFRLPTSHFPIPNSNFPIPPSFFRLPHSHFPIAVSLYKPRFRCYFRLIRTLRSGSHITNY